MAQRGQTVPFVASAQVTNRTLVKMTGDKTVGPCTAATDQPIGVAEFDAIIGATCPVIISGIAKVRVGAAIAPQTNSRMASDATGRAVPAAPAAGTNNGIVGFAVEAAAGANAEIDVLIEPSVFQG